MSPDVVVVGGGLAGLSVAAHLAGEASVVVLEQGEQLGAEASAQNAGMVRRLGEDPYERALACRTHDWLEQIGDWGGRQPSRRSGALLALAHDPHELHDAVAHLRGRVALEACDRPAEVAPVLGGARLAAAWWLPDERIADAWTLVSGWAADARAAGAQLRTGARVEALRVHGGRCVGVVVDGEAVDAGAVVLAAGAWSATLAATAGLARPLIPLARTLLQTEADPRSTGHPWTWIDDEGIYVRPEGGGWLLSACDEAVRRPGLGPGSRGPVDELVRARALDKAGRLLPALGPLRFRGGWTGLRTFAPDRRPVLGPDAELPGLHWAAGLGGFGVTCSFAVGECVAAWLRGEAVDYLAPAAVAPARAYPGRWPVRPTGERRRARLISGRA